MLVLEEISVLITTWPHEVGLKIVILSGHPKLLDKNIGGNRSCDFSIFFACLLKQGCFFLADFSKAPRPLVIG